MYDLDSISTSNKINNQIHHHHSTVVPVMELTGLCMDGVLLVGAIDRSVLGGEAFRGIAWLELIIIEMSRGLLATLSALTLVGGSVAVLLWRKLVPAQEEVAERLTIKRILIQLRKRVYSTLREISFIVNNIRTLEGDLDVRKISEIFMRDGGSGEKKLEAIEALVLAEAHLTPLQFQHSCNYYIQHDIEIRILLESFRKDLDLALQGVIETYNGPLPRLPAEKILRIQQQIMRRRMEIIYRKFAQGASDEECLRLEGQIEEYLLMQGIQHDREPNEKLFLSILEHHYRSDADFRDSFERLEIEMEMFIIEIENKSRVEKQRRQEENQRKEQEAQEGQEAQKVPEGERSEGSMEQRWNDPYRQL